MITFSIIENYNFVSLQDNNRISRVGEIRAIMKDRKTPNRLSTQH